MQAIRLEKPGHFELLELEHPAAPGPREVLLKTHAVGICGTDIAGYLGKFPFFTYPKIIGHELGVEVLAVGSDVKHLVPGDRCSVEPYINCGHCYACRRGATNCCQTNLTLGVMTDGGFCEQFILRADKVHRSRELRYEQLALVETLAIGCHASDRGGPRPEDKVLVIGAGPIGLAVIEFVRLTGAEVGVIDLSPSRLDFCRQTYQVSQTILYQSDEQVREEIEQWTHGDRCPLVFDATGNRQSMSAAFHLVSQTGTLVYVGITSEEISFPQAILHKPEITLKSSRNALSRDFPRIIRLIENGTVNTDPWITHRSTFERFIEDFPQWLRPGTGIIKGVVQVSSVTSSS